MNQAQFIAAARHGAFLTFHLTGGKTVSGHLEMHDQQNDFLEAGFLEVTQRASHDDRGLGKVWTFPMQSVVFIEMETE